MLDHCPRDICEGIEAAKNLTRNRIFTNPQKARLELVASASLHVLLGALMPLALHREDGTFRQHRLSIILEHHGATLGKSPYENMMQILDVITALSDHQAYALAQDIKGNRGNMV